MAQNATARLKADPAPTPSGGAPATPPTLMAETSGLTLARARRGAGLSIETLAERTNIKPEHLTAIEAGDHGRLPAPVFAAGHVKTYARALGLDPYILAEQFHRECAPSRAAAPVPAASIAAKAAPATNAHDDGDEAAARIISMAGVIVSAGMALGLFVYIALQPLLSKAPMSGTPKAAAPTHLADLTGAAVPAIETADNPAPGAPSPTPIETSAVIDGGEESVPIADEIFELREDKSLEQLNASRAPVRIVNEAAAIEPAPAPALAVNPIETIQPTPNLPTSNLPAPSLAPAPKTPDVILRARLKRGAAPVYPSGCEREAASREVVSLIFDVTPAGRAANIRVSATTNACFNEAAMRTVRKWRFAPRTVNGATVRELGKAAMMNFDR